MLHCCRLVWIWTAITTMSIAGALIGALAGDNASPLCSSPAFSPTIRSFSCKLTRVQSYNGAAEVATAKVEFDKDAGIRYSYTSPFPFTLTVTRSSITAFDPSLKTGYRGSRDSASVVFVRDLDIVGWVLEWAACCGEYTLAGSLDSTIFYSRPLSDPAIMEFIALDRNQHRLRAIEWFSGSTLIRQCLVYYRSGRSDFPSSIVVKRPLDGTVVRDSIELSSVKFDQRFAPGSFTAPGDITWRGLPETARKFPR